jgi:hypothetical protein
MSLFVEVESNDKNCKVILNLDTVSEIAPMVAGGCTLFLNDGRIYKVKDSYDQFKQFAMQTVSSEDISKKVKSLKSQAASLQPASLEIPKL